MNSSRNHRMGWKVLRGGEAQLLERAVVTTPLDDLVLELPDEPAVAEVLDPIAEAYQAGLEAGSASAEAEAAREQRRAHEVALDRLVASLGAAASAVSENRQLLVDQILGEVGDLVLLLVRELVAEELALREEPARAAIERALRFAPPDIDLVVHLNPKDEIAAWELESLVPGRRIRVVEDDRVEVGGCVLEVGSARIDAQIGPALERLKSAFAHLQVVPDLEEAG